MVPLNVKRSTSPAVPMVPGARSPQPRGVPGRMVVVVVDGVVMLVVVVGARVVVVVDIVVVVVGVRTHPPLPFVLQQERQAVACFRHAARARMKVWRASLLHE